MPAGSGRFPDDLWRPDFISCAQMLRLGSSLVCGLVRGVDDCIFKYSCPVRKIISPYDIELTWRRSCENWLLHNRFDSNLVLVEGLGMRVRATWSRARRTLQKPTVQRVLTHRPFAKQLPGWVALLANSNLWTLSYSTRPDPRRPMRRPDARFWQGLVKVGLLARRSASSRQAGRWHFENYYYKQVLRSP